MRRALVAAALASAFLVVSQLVLPGPGSAGRGTPAAVLFAGAVRGLIASLTTAGIILVYRATRVVNFAQAAIGVVGATLVFELVRYTEVPFAVAFPVGLATAALAGVLFELVFGRRFAGAPRLVLTVVTIAGAELLAGLAGQVTRLPFFPPADARGIQDYSPERFRAYLPFPGFRFHVGSFELPFGFPELFAVEVVVVALGGLAAFLYLTRAGVAIRGMSENAERAALLGISVGGLSTVVWGVAGGLSGAAASLRGLVDSPQQVGGFAPELLLPALAAAVIARMESVTTGAVASVGIAVGTAAVERSYPGSRPLVDLALFLVVGIGLVLQRRRRGRSETGATSSWQATEELRPVPPELAGLPGIRAARTGAVVVATIAVGLFPFLVSTRLLLLGGATLLTVIVALSLVVLTGWAGQVSLGQYAFVAVGAVAGGALTNGVGVPFWIAVPLATALTAAFAVVVGVPALRIPGLFLGVTTFAFAVAVPSLLRDENGLGGLLPDAVDRPSLLLLDFEDERSMFYLCAACLLVAVLAVTNLRRTRWGRLLLAVRDNEAAVQAVGVSVVRVKLTAFALSGALAGFAGAVFAHHQRGVSLGSFGAVASVEVFLLAVIGGLSSPIGALLGALYFRLTTQVVTDPLLSVILGPGFTLLLLYSAPGGLVSLFVRVRDEVLRIVAQRRRIVVPSLFADMDAEALANQLIPLAPRPSGAPAGDDFALGSVLYPTASRPIRDGGGAALARPAVQGGSS